MVRSRTSDSEVVHLIPIGTTTSTQSNSAFHLSAVDKMGSS